MVGAKSIAQFWEFAFFQVRGSLARKALRELLAKGLIKQVVSHNAQSIYTRLIKDDEEIEAEKAAAAAAEKK